MKRSLILTGFAAPFLAGMALTQQVGTLEELPLAFVENRGQWDTPAQFVARRGPLVARLEADALILELRRRRAEGQVQTLVARIHFEGARESVELVGESAQAGIHNFFLGSDPGEWRQGVTGFSSVLYRGLYEGVDLRVREHDGRLEYDLLLAPGADLEGVVFRCAGTTGLDVESDGSLRMRSALGPILQSPPKTWAVQPDGARKPLECAFRKLDEERYGFRLPAGDPDLPVVIDPGLEWATFLGGSGDEALMALGVDGAGRAVVAGRTYSSDFDTTVGAYETTFQGVEDAFVACLDPTQPGPSQLVWSTFLGGGLRDRILDLELDSAGNVFVIGHTRSSDFPTTAPVAPYDSVHNGGWDAFVAKLSADGGTLSYSTFLGGLFDDQAGAIALEEPDTVTIAGTTQSPGFPTSGAAQSTLNGARDYFLSRLDLSLSGGSALLYSTYVGGSGLESVANLDDTPLANRLVDVDLSLSGEVVMTGVTWSTDFPTVSAYDSSLGGNGDAFITCVDPSIAGPQGFVYSTYIGGSGNDWGRAIDLDASGVVTLGGYTVSSDFPTTVGAMETTYQGGQDTFVLRLDPSLAPGSQLEYSSFLGGEAVENLRTMAVDASGGVVLVGRTHSIGFPTTCGAYGTQINGVHDAFVTYLNPVGTGASDLLYSTFIGGSGGDEGLNAVGFASTAPVPTLMAAGNTASADHPTPDGYDGTLGGSRDGVVLQLELNPLAFCIAAPNSAGDGALICGSGSTSVAANDFTLSVAGAAPFQPGVFFFGPNAIEIPFGDGFRCVGGLVVRLNPPVPADASGAASRPVDLGVPPSDVITPGSLWHFQFWYRDPAAGGQGFNLSNGLKAVFHP